MKLFAPALIFCGAVAFGQPPQVPHKMKFAGMTLTIRDDARREIQKDVDALTQHPKYFQVKVERAKTYFPVIEKIFAEERLPDEFKYLALQESALIPDAVSTSNAVGFWQFKDFTAQEMGLRVDAAIDERMHIASASRGAARYLKQCNHYFNNWVYALQAYQMGAGGVMRMVGDTDLGERHMEITTETYWYVKKFLAHQVAFENAVTGKASVEVEQIGSAGGRTLADIARETATSETRLREFNKWLKTDRIPTDKDYPVFIPRGEGSANFGVLAVASGTSSGTVRVSTKVNDQIEVNGVPGLRARKGESLTAIAQRGGIGIEAFLRYNDMAIDKPLEEGQVYFVHKKKKRAEQELYTVGHGEDLWLVSQRFAVTQKSLRKFNRLDPGTKLAAGATLFLQNKGPGVHEPSDSQVAQLDAGDSFDWDPSPVRNAGLLTSRGPDQDGGDRPAGTAVPSDLSVVPSDGIHQVKASDTLYSVSRQYGVTIKDLVEWNGKKDFSLTVGEKLKVRPH